MIKVEFMYWTLKNDSPKLMAKFNESKNNKKFVSDITIKIEISQREERCDIPRCCRYLLCNND